MRRKWGKYEIAHLSDYNHFLTEICVQTRNCCRTFDCHTYLCAQKPSRDFPNTSEVPNSRGYSIPYLPHFGLKPSH